MSFTNDSSDSEWKETKKETDKAIKLGLSSSYSGKTKYSQKFCDKWLNIFHPWLTRCDDDLSKPFCRACQCRLDCNRCHLQRHERTIKHARNLEILLSKGEGAARQNLSIRQERSKYYQQRKKLNSSLASPNDISDMGLEGSEDYIDGPEGETGFQFVQTETAVGDPYTEETTMKLENEGSFGHCDPLPSSSTPKLCAGTRTSVPKKGIKKERMKLLMQIQKDKNDLMDSFKELMGGSGVFQQSSPPREKNHVDLFFESVSSSVKALSPKLVAEAKMRVSQLICELELRALTESDANMSATASSTTAVVVAATPDTVNAGGAYIINQPVTVLHRAQHVSEQYETIS